MIKIYKYLSDIIYKLLYNKKFIEYFYLQKNEGNKKHFQNISSNVLSTDQSPSSRRIRKHLTLSITGMEWFQTTIN